MPLKFTFRQSLSVRAPYRLDLTAIALRRLAANVVDVLDERSGCYRRALADERGVNVVRVRQDGARTLQVEIAGAHGARWLPVVERMLGTRADLREWYGRVESFAWLRRAARRLRGLKPPRYPDLWEALSHAIVFQQISIHAAGAIMRRLVEALSSPVRADGIDLYPFPRPLSLARASDAKLRAAGLSANKVAHLRAAAEAVLAGAVDGEQLESLATAEATERLCAIRGIGPWSAAVVMLRGFGRLDTFPLRDSGVARSLERLRDGESVDVDALLTALGPTRGMLYFHLLLGRMHPPAVQLGSEEA